MPAPPYSCGTEMPSSPIFAMPPRMRSRSKWCLRSFSRMNGATFWAPHSRIVCSSRWCSSLSVKSIMAKPEILSRGPGDLHRRTAPEIEPFGGARAVVGDLQMVRAAEERADVAVRGLRIRGDDARHHVRAGANVERAAGDLVEAAAIDVRDQVAEAIDAQHLAVDAVGGDLWFRDLELVNRAGRSAERRQLDALREPRRRRRKPIATLERAAHRRPRVLPLGQLDDAFRRMLVEDGGQHPVVGRDELVVAGFGRDAPTRRADAGIGDDDK